MPDQEPLRLTSLDIQNILRIRAVSLEVGDDAVIIEGGNEEGKSSVLEALEIVLAGGKRTPDEPIHGDEKKGKIVATFGDLTVTKVFMRGKSPALKIMSGQAKFKSPQALLETFLDFVALRPLQFLDYDWKKKMEVLSGLMGLDTAKLDRQEEGTYDSRKDANREAKRLKAVYDSLPYQQEAPKEEVKVAELMAELEEVQKHNARVEWLDADFTRVSDKLRDAQASRVELQRRVDNLDAEIDALVEKEADANRESSTHKRKDDSPLRAQIAAADDTNAAIRANAAKKEARKAFNAAETKALDLDDALEEIKKRRAAARKEAAERLPVPELSLTDDGIYYKDKPLAQAGSSAQLRVSVAVAMALNEDKRIKLLLLDDAEKLDAGNTRLVLEMAAEKGFQVLLARVGDGKEASVVIEDGEIKA